ncbi:MAG TPA: hypothetical protein VM925_21795 [Labilithrix sp.]|nr:hypothetical protein [Labilithrix sp.]
MFFQPSSAALDPTVKANLMPYAKTMPDDRARDLLDLSDATPYGTRQRFVRMGIGAAAGLVLGLVLGRASKR